MQLIVRTIILTYVYIIRMIEPPQQALFNRMFFLVNMSYRITSILNYILARRSTSFCGFQLHRFTDQQAPLFMLPLHAIAHVTFSTTLSLLLVFSPRHRRSSSGSMFSSHAHPDTSLEELFEAYTRRGPLGFFLRFQGKIPG